jgi:polysaccharide deacetylase
MKNKIILTLLLTATILSSCSNSNNEPVTPDANDVQAEAPVDVSNENTNNNQANTESQQNLDVDPIESIDMSLEPNEIGEIMIVMYHGIGDKESDWQRTPENFRKDLEYMYQNGYRMISLNDYAKGIITTQAGYTPIILTFDDGRQNNFDITEKNGEYIINPDCAIGILEEFKEKYPDFDVTASFFLNSSPFGQQEYIDYKLKWLVDNGYDIGNHTYTHDEIANLNGEEIQSEIGSINNILHQYIPDYAVETLALPHGSNPKDEYAKYVLDGSYEEKSYKNIAVLDVGWRPAYSPFDTCTDFSSLYRVTGSEMNVQNCGIYDYFKQFEENKREKFVSDGNPNVVTIPKKYEEYIDMDIVGDRILNIFE